MKHIPGKVIVKADIEGKNWHTFTHGLRIRIERDYNNLDRKHTQQVLGEVVSAEEMPEEAMILFHFNAIHPVNMINNHSQLSGDEIASGIRYFSFREDECYLWKKYGSKSWNPTKGFAIVYYVFQPYNGPLLGIQPKKLKNILYIARGGNYEGKVCRVLNYSGMPIIFLNEKGNDETIIRIRTYKEYNEREEVAAIDEGLTEKLEKGELLIGISENNCKTLKEFKDEFDK